MPFWMVFNTEPSLAGIQRYLDAAGPFEEIRLTLFSHGADLDAFLDRRGSRYAVDWK